MAELKLKIKKVEYEAPRPKVKFLKQLIRFNSDFKSEDMMKSPEVIDKILKIVSGAFNNKEVTPEILEEELEISDLFKVFGDISVWIADFMGGDKDGKNAPSL